MIRLFTALPISEEVGGKLAHLEQDIEGCRWVSPMHYHITLFFIGDVNVWMFRQIKQQLQQIVFDPFEINIKGTGVFPSQDNPRVIWAGVEENKSLNELQKEVSELLFSMGIEGSNTKFKPHISLAGCAPQTNPDNIQEFCKQHKNLSISNISVSEFKLFSSRLAVEGAMHSEVATYHAYTNELTN